MDDESNLYITIFVNNNDIYYINKKLTLLVDDNNILIKFFKYSEEFFKFIDKKPYYAEKIKATEYMLLAEEDTEVYSPQLATLKQDYQQGIAILKGGEASPQQRGGR